MSGMPGMCLKIKDGGIGFDYRLSMGMPDLWIKLIKEYSDENWDVGKLWYELTTRRPKEKSIGYAESHDQALVGDKTIIFRLCDAEMYTAMNKESKSMIIDRGIALHKMIRLITLSLAGEGYLNFMGNEFGHPEWIDFPREGNGWSYHYCRRQWSLADNDLLRYGGLQEFDKAMIKLAKKDNITTKKIDDSYIHYDNKVIIFRKGDNIFAFNFNPSRSFEGLFVKTDTTGKFKVELSTDFTEFGGFNRVDKKYKYYATYQKDGSTGFKIYLPSRTAIVFKRVKEKIK
jgi:1,4-alpha-glucan branching enzyme